MISEVPSNTQLTLEWPGKMWLQNIFDKISRIDIMGAEQGREGPGWARPGPSRPCPTPISFIPEILIKNIHAKLHFPRSF